jgi:hypothetical protein
VRRFRREGLVKRTLFPFDRSGFSHELVEQSWPVCLVKRSKLGRQLHWEVVVLQQHAARQWPDGRFTPAGWHYPASEQWGEAGWTYADMSRAHRRLSESRKHGVKDAASINIADHVQNASQAETGVI